MADIKEMRIFSADQIQVPKELPDILKNFSKEVIRANPDDLVHFARVYFEGKVAEQQMEAAQAAQHQRQ